MSVRTIVFIIIALALVAVGCNEAGPKPANKNNAPDAGQTGKNAPKGSAEASGRKDRVSSEACQR